MQSKVVNKFKETRHEGHIYEVGDTYPAEGYETDADRVAFLSAAHPRYQKIFLTPVEPEKPKRTRSKTVKGEVESSDKE